MSTRELIILFVFLRCVVFLTSVSVSCVGTDVCRCRVYSV